MKIQHIASFEVLPDNELGEIDAYTLITDDDGKVIRLDPPDLDHPLKRPTRRGLNRLLDDIEEGPEPPEEDNTLIADPIEFDVDGYRDDLNERNGLR
ncbi:MAG: hypothetical protein ABIH23_26255 [bacterium]